MSDMVKFEGIKEDLIYKLRLNKLDKVSRTLQKHRVIDSNGFLTPTGAMVFLDALWQKHPEIRKEISEELAKLDKSEKGKQNENE